MGGAVGEEAGALEELAALAAQEEVEETTGAAAGLAQSVSAGQTKDASPAGVAKPNEEEAGEEKKEKTRRV